MANLLVLGGLVFRLDEDPRSLTENLKKRNREFIPVTLISDAKLYVNPERLDYFMICEEPESSEASPVASVQSMVKE